MTLFLALFSVLLIVFTLLPLVRSDYWTFRVFDYPRLQKLTLSCTCFPLLILYFNSNYLVYWICTGAISANIIYLLVLIIPYTVLGKKQVIRIDASKPENEISIMIANVYQDNKNIEGCLNEVSKANPDVLLLLETNSTWETGTHKLEEHYPYTVKVPLENTYGMLLYSKLEFADAQIKYLVEKDIPSIHAVVVLKSGQKIRLFAVHPTPPVPGENPRSTERDKEMLLIADMAKDAELPVIVVGDLNDVAWSHTTRLFLKMSGLLDPRRGRGFFNSFNAHYPMLRFPLDHAFISTDFKLKRIKRLNNFNSDHFPIFISLQHEPQAAAEQTPLQPDAADIKEASEKKEKI
jgi:endonuclease/exonuclease/phosphatase (EEP) superfamily protein YafD